MKAEDAIQLYRYQAAQIKEVADLLQAGMVEGCEDAARMRALAIQLAMKSSVENICFAAILEDLSEKIDFELTTLSETRNREAPADESPEERDSLREPPFAADFFLGTERHNGGAWKDKPSSQRSLDDMPDAPRFPRFSEEDDYPDPEDGYGESFL